MRSLAPVAKLCRPLRAGFAVRPGGFGASLGNDVSLLQTAAGPCRSVLSATRAVGLLVVRTREGRRADLADAPRLA